MSKIGSGMRGAQAVGRGFTNLKSRATDTPLKLPVVLMSQIADQRPRMRRFANAVNAVAFAIGANLHTKRLEKGVFSGVTKKGYTVKAWVIQDGRKLSTDDWVPLVARAKEARKKREASTKEVLARLDQAGGME